MLRKYRALKKRYYEEWGCISDYQYNIYNFTLPFDFACIHQLLPIVIKIINSDKAEIYHVNYLKSFKDVVTKILQLFKSFSQGINSRNIFRFNPQV